MVNLGWDETQLQSRLGNVLSRNEILAAIHREPPLVRNYINVDTQLQPAGFEITLGEVYRFKNAGTIGFTNEQRRLADAEPLTFENDSIHLTAGCYLVRYNEVVKLPNDIVALIFPRSSIMRCGAILYTAVWDPGYEGKGQGLLNVYNSHGLTVHKNARIGQMIFLRLSAPVTRGYSGMYQKEGL